MGGLLPALEMTGPIDVFLHPDALKPKYNQTGRDIGISELNTEQLESFTRNIIEIIEPTEISSGVYVTGETPRVHSIENTGGALFITILK